MLASRIRLLPRRLPSLSSSPMTSAFFSTSSPSSPAPDVKKIPDSSSPSKTTEVRLSKLISQYSDNMPISRREAERLIRAGEVTFAGEVVTSPHYLISLEAAKSAVKISGKLARIRETKQQFLKTRVWLVHKLAGEVVTDMDPRGRPSLLDRLRRGGVGNKNEHLKAIGRLDMNTEGLIVVTNDGEYKRLLELPSNKVHRVYRVRVHGKLTPYKLKTMRGGVMIDNVRYQGMSVHVEARAARRTSSTNTWLRITTVEGKNRMIRKVVNHLGMTVTRLLRIGYGDYDLNTIPSGMALEVPVKRYALQKKTGKLVTKKRHPKEVVKKDGSAGAPVTWVTSV